MVRLAMSTQRLTRTYLLFVLLFTAAMAGMATLKARPLSASGGCCSLNGLCNDPEDCFAEFCQGDCFDSSPTCCYTGKCSTKCG